jgi:hypothetical protein
MFELDGWLSQRTLWRVAHGLLDAVAAGVPLVTSQKSLVVGSQYPLVVLLWTEVGSEHSESTSSSGSQVVVGAAVAKTLVDASGEVVEVWQPVVMLPLALHPELAATGEMALLADEPAAVLENTVFAADPVVAAVAHPYNSPVETSHSALVVAAIEAVVAPKPRTSCSASPSVSLELGTIVPPLARGSLAYVVFNVSDEATETAPAAGWLLLVVPVFAVKALLAEIVRRTRIKADIIMMTPVTAPTSPARAFFVFSVSPAEERYWKPA